MIIDLILDRKAGVEYNVLNHLDYIKAEQEIFEFTPNIYEAFKSGDDNQAKRALCKYIDEHGYNPEIKEYIKSVSWTNESVPAAILVKERSDIFEFDN